MHLANDKIRSFKITAGTCALKCEPTGFSDESFFFPFNLQYIIMHRCKIFQPYYFIHVDERSEKRCLDIVETDSAELDASRQSLWDIATCPSSSRCNCHNKAWPKTSYHQEVLPTATRTSQHRQIFRKEWQHKAIIPTEDNG